MWTGQCYSKTWPPRPPNMTNYFEICFAKYCHAQKNPYIGFPCSHTVNQSEAKSEWHSSQWPNVRQPERERVPSSLLRTSMEGLLMPVSNINSKFVSLYTVTFNIHYANRSNICSQNVRTAEGPIRCTLLLWDPSAICSQTSSGCSDHLDTPINSIKGASVCLLRGFHRHTGSRRSLCWRRTILYTVSVLGGSPACHKIALLFPLLWL